MCRPSFAIGVGGNNVFCVWFLDLLINPHCKQTIVRTLYSKLKFLELFEFVASLTPAINGWWWSYTDKVNFKCFPFGLKCINSQTVKQPTNIYHTGEESLDFWAQRTCKLPLLWRWTSWKASAQRDFIKLVMRMCISVCYKRTQRKRDADGLPIFP